MYSIFKFHLAKSCSEVPDNFDNIFRSAKTKGPALAIRIPYPKKKKKKKKKK